METVLLDLTSHVYRLLDEGNDVFIILLDLSAAFDTIDHSLILNTLQSDFNVEGLALQWIHSYLSERSFRVKVRQTLSKKFPLTVGVPQGSILGPILFNCVMAKLCKILTAKNIYHHIYADDTQLVFAVSKGEEQAVRDLIASTFKLISDFMMANHLKINPEKTTFIPISRHDKQFISLKLTDMSPLNHAAK